MLIDFLPVLIGAGIIAGFLAGLLGIGGGIVTVPVMFIVFAPLGVPDAWRMQACVATSLCIIIATSLSSVRAHHKRSGIDWSIARYWAVFVAGGAMLGVQVAQQIKSETLVYIFASCASLLAVKMFVPTDRWQLGTAVPRGVKGSIAPLGLGFIASIMGIGGGVISVPYLTLFGVPVHRAVGTAAVIGLTASLVAALSFLLSSPPIGLDGPPGMVGFVHLPTAVIIAAASVFVAPLGAAVAHRLPKPVLSILFGVFILAAVLRLITSV